MILYMLNSDFKKVLLIRKYTFAQHQEEFRGLGAFKVIAPYDSQNKAMITRSIRYVLFETGDGRDVVGKIEKVNYESDIDSNRTITVTGRLMQFIFDKRVVKGTVKFKGKIHTYIKKLINESIIEPSDTNRAVTATVAYSNASRLESLSKTIDTQQTGGTVWEEIEKYLESNNYGIIVRPEIVPLQEINGAETNIKNFRYIISAGRDLTVDNTDSNAPVVFSQGISNIYRTEYEIERESHCTVAYTAGEGEETARKWYELLPSGYSTTKGFNRLEMWVDARDIQSEDENGNKLTDAQYDALIKDRTNEKFEENPVNAIYAGTIKAAEGKYKYNRNFYLGDTVMIMDSDLNLMLDAQITSVTTSYEGSEKTVDVDFTNGRIKYDIRKQLKAIQKQLNSNNVAIKALQKK